MKSTIGTIAKLALVGLLKTAKFLAEASDRAIVRAANQRSKGL